MKYTVSQMQDATKQDVILIQMFRPFLGLTDTFHHEACICIGDKVEIPCKHFPRKIFQFPNSRDPDAYSAWSF